MSRCETLERYTIRARHYNTRKSHQVERLKTRWTLLSAFLPTWLVIFIWSLSLSLYIITPYYFQRLGSFTHFPCHFSPRLGLFFVLVSLCVLFIFNKMMHLQLTHRLTTTTIEMHSFSVFASFDWASERHILKWLCVVQNDLRFSLITLLRRNWASVKNIPRMLSRCSRMVWPQTHHTNELRSKQWHTCAQCVPIHINEFGNWRYTLDVQRSNYFRVYEFFNRKTANPPNEKVSDFYIHICIETDHAYGIYIRV